MMNIVYISIGSILLVAIIFYSLVALSKRNSYSDDDDDVEFTKPTEFWTSDVIDDDIDDRYIENDWSSTDYNSNDFSNKNY